MRALLLGLLILGTLATALPVAAADHCYTNVRTVGFACYAQHWADDALTWTVEAPLCVYNHGVPYCAASMPPLSFYRWYTDCYLIDEGPLNWASCAV